MSATEAIAAVENLAARTVRAEQLLELLHQSARLSDDGAFFQVPADALSQVRAYLRST